MVTFLLIAGSLPASWRSLTNLQYLSLAGNRVSGVLPGVPVRSDASQRAGRFIVSSLYARRAM